MKQLFTKVITEPNSGKKSNSRPKDIDPLEESQGLSCLVYKIKNHPKSVLEDKKNKNTENIKNTDLNFANMPSILMKRKTSKPESGTEPTVTLNSNKKNRKVEESQDYS